MTRTARFRAQQLMRLSLASTLFLMIGPYVSMPAASSRTQLSAVGPVMLPPAGILLPLAYISHRDPSATVTVFPSDHFVVKEDPFLAAAGRAVAEVQHFSRQLILLGALPDQAEGDYGWIEPARHESGRESRSVL